MLIMKTFIDTFMCRWYGDAPWFLYRAPFEYWDPKAEIWIPNASKLECLSNDHMVLLALGVIVLINIFFIFYFCLIKNKYFFTILRD